MSSASKGRSPSDYIPLTTGVLTSTVYAGADVLPRSPCSGVPIQGAYALPVKILILWYMYIKFSNLSFKTKTCVPIILKSLKSLRHTHSLAALTIIFLRPTKFDKRYMVNENTTMRPNALSYHTKVSNYLFLRSLYTAWQCWPIKM